MSFLYEEKASTSPFVDVIWHTVDTSDGTYLAAADACWDVIFTRITGRSQRQVRQIARAREAAARLRTGEAIADVAYELGYADQSHLTRDVKRLTGYTPAESQRRDEPV